MVDSCIVMYECVVNFVFVESVCEERGGEG
jgi:hypothetical protein